MAEARILPVTSSLQNRVVRRAHTAIDEGAVCQYHSDFVKVIELGTGVWMPFAVGVAVEDAAAGADVELVTSGVVDALVDGNTDVAVGDHLVAHSSTTGAVLKDATIHVDDSNSICVAMEARTADSIALTKIKVNFG